MPPETALMVRVRTSMPSPLYASIGQDCALLFDAGASMAWHMSTVGQHGLTPRGRIVCWVDVVHLDVTLTRGVLFAGSGPHNNTVQLPRARQQSNFAICFSAALAPCGELRPTKHRLYR